MGWQFPLPGHALALSAAGDAERRGYAEKMIEQQIVTQQPRADLLKGAPRRIDFKHSGIAAGSAAAGSGDFCGSTQYLRAPTHRGVAAIAGSRGKDLPHRSGWGGQVLSGRSLGQS